MIKICGVQLSLLMDTRSKKLNSMHFKCVLLFPNFNYFINHGSVHGFQMESSILANFLEYKSSIPTAFQYLKLNIIKSNPTSPLLPLCHSFLLVAPLPLQKLRLNICPFYTSCHITKCMCG